MPGRNVLNRLTQGEKMKRSCWATGSRARVMRRTTIAAAALIGMSLLTVVEAPLPVSATPVPSGGSVVQTIGVGTQPKAVSSDGVHVWTANYGSHSVTEIDAATGSVVRTIQVGYYPASISSDGVDVWVLSVGLGSISEIDAATGTVIRTIDWTLNDTDGFTQALTSDGTHVWVIGSNNDVVELNASDGSVVRVIDVGNQPSAISSDGTNVWVANYSDGTVTEITAATGVVVNTIFVGDSPTGVSSDGTHVWVANTMSRDVTEITAATGDVVNTISVAEQPWAISSDGMQVWVANQFSNSTTEIDASNGSVVQTIATGLQPVAISSDGSRVWVANIADNAVTELSEVAFTSIAPSGEGVSGSPYWPTAIGGTSTSPVVITLDPASTGCTLDGGAVSFPSMGTCVIDANQAGDANHAAAQQVQQSLAVGAQTINFTNPTGGVVGTSATLAATGGASGNAVIFSVDASSGAEVCNVSGTNGITVNYTAQGTCVIDANQAGNANYAAATEVQRSIAVLLGLPGTPSAVIAFAGDASATVSWNAPASDGGSAVTGYTVTSSSEGRTCHATTTLSCVVTGLNDGVIYTFTVTATSSVGTGLPSAASNSVVPSSNTAGITSANSTTIAGGKGLKFLVTTSGTPTATVSQTGMASWMTLTLGAKSKSGTAVLGGTSPSGGGTFTVTIHANNGVGPDTIQVLTVHVLAFTSISTASFTKGVYGSFTITTSDSAAILSATLSASKEAGLSFTNNGDGTATVSGTPGSAAKTASVTVTATVGSIKVKQKLTVSIN